eukprot:SAG31_NODE_429_length_15801_cov_6.878551_13_plen_153_part_00
MEQGSLDDNINFLDFLAHDTKMRQQSRRQMQVRKQLVLRLHAICVNASGGSLIWLELKLWCHCGRASMRIGDERRCQHGTLSQEDRYRNPKSSMFAPHSAQLQISTCSACRRCSGDIKSCSIALPNHGCEKTNVLHFRNKSHLFVSPSSSFQ